MKKNFVFETIQPVERSIKEWTVLNKKLICFKKNRRVVIALIKKKRLIDFTRKICIDATNKGEGTYLTRRLHK